MPHIYTIPDYIYIYTLIIINSNNIFTSYRFGLHLNWDKLQIFVLHLAICDILYCAIPLPFYASVYLGNQWIFGEVWCKITSILAHIFLFTSWMALALIALSRVLAVLAPSVLRRVCTNYGSKCIIIFAWIFVVMLLIPFYFEVI